MRFTVFFTLFISAHMAWGKASLNAGCELVSGLPIVGTNEDEPFVVASLSKIFTTYWALEKIGADFQFDTEISIEPVGTAGTTVNIHIRGDADPTWGREMLHYLVSELDRRGVRKIKRLTFDENFLFYFDFVEHAGSETVFPTVDDIQRSLKKNFIPSADDYKLSLAKAQLSSLALVEKLQIKAPQEIDYLSATDFKRASNATVFSVRSLPLYKILKLMNIASNNYLADNFFDQLGGPKAFKDFVGASVLAPFLFDLDLLNGSGFPIKIGGKKNYNRASCASITHTLSQIDISLGKMARGLEFVFPIATSDKSTLDKYELPPDLMIAKTGTVSPTIALAGMILTTNGPKYFSQLIKTDSSKDWDDARALIKSYLDNLISTEAQPLNYVPSVPSFWAEANVMSTVLH